jgi:serine/threonine-protein kinase
MMGSKRATPSMKDEPQSLTVPDASLGVDPTSASVSIQPEQDPAAPGSAEIDISQASFAHHEKPTTPESIQTTLFSDDNAENVSDAENVRSPSDYVGQIIDGRYHVLSIIAQGGMGVVYRCKHRTIDKAVAIKILRPDLATDRDVTERFLIEAKAASSIGNRHIIDVTDFGELADGAMYLAMEFLEGVPLSRRLRQEPRLTVSEIIGITRQIAEGLHAAHEGGIVHRDLKPDNIFLIQEDTGAYFVKILDFGIAKVSSTQSKLTRAGKIFGTPHYMAPEQGSGSSVDRRTDVYSLGVILYEMASGHIPFDAENPLGILTQHMYVPPIPPNERPDAVQQIPVGLEAVILKCLSKDPEHRYMTMQELAEDLMRVEKGEVALAISDLLYRGADELPLKRLRAASVQPPPNTKRPVSGAWLGFGLSAILVISLVAVTVFPGGKALLGNTNAASSGTVPPPATAAGDASAPPKTNARMVALVLSPIDAHVFDGARDLGTMPISIKITENEVATLQVRREGFTTAHIRVDGSNPKLIVELQPIPGATPKVPVPEHMRVDAPQHDGGMRVITLEKRPRTDELGTVEPAATDLGAPSGDSTSPAAGGAATEPSAHGGTAGDDSITAPENPPSEGVVPLPDPSEPVEPLPDLPPSGTPSELPEAPPSDPQQ